MITDYLKIEGNATFITCAKNKKYVSYTGQGKDVILIYSKY